MARNDYSCHKCSCMIFAGEYYVGEVMVFGKRLWVRRCHYFDCPDHPPDEKESTIPNPVAPPIQNAA